MMASCEAGRECMQLLGSLATMLPRPSHAFTHSASRPLCTKLSEKKRKVFLGTQKEDKYRWHNANGEFSSPFHLHCSIFKDTPASALSDARVGFGVGCSTTIRLGSMRSRCLDGRQHKVVKHGQVHVSIRLCRSAIVHPGAV